MHLIRLLLPLHDNNKQEFPIAYFVKVREELTDRFGGVTAFVRSPPVGLWKDANKVSRDNMVMFEVMSNQLDKEWWSNYRTQLQKISPRGTVDLGIRRHKALTTDHS